MYVSGKILASSAAIMLSVCANAFAASPVRVGLFNSVKGFGAQMLLGNADETDSFRTLTIYADLLDIYFGSGNSSGVKALYYTKYVTHRETIEDFKYNFFLGAGFQAGYCGDSFFGNLKNPGFEAGACLCAGWLLEFTKRIDLEITFNLEAGLHLRKEEKYGSPALSFYLNGIARSLVPDLTIYYRF